MKYSKRTVDEAVQLLDCYASQLFWSVDRHCWIGDVAFSLGIDNNSIELALAAWRDVPGDVFESALEAAQRLREGWRP